MRKLRIFFATLFFLSVITVSAQRNVFNQSFGLSGGFVNVGGTIVGKMDTIPARADYKAKVLQFGIVYYPRIDLVSWKGGSFSIGAPVMLGFSLSGRYASTDHIARTPAPDSIAVNTGINGAFVAFTIPVVADLNIGLHSAVDNQNSAIGIFVGAGYAYNFTQVKTSVGYAPVDTYETMFRTGLRLGRTWENRFTLGFNVRGLFMENAHPRSYEIHLLKDL